MNGIHDMGGMHGMGPIRREAIEPVFHEGWEGRVFALTTAVEAWGKWTLDASRHGIERIRAAEYLRMSYYEKWLTSLVALMTETGLASEEEIRSGEPAPGSARAVPVLPANQVAAMLAEGVPASRQEGASARFRAGQRVRARNLNPTGHTR